MTNARNLELHWLPMRTLLFLCLFSLVLIGGAAAQEAIAPERTPDVPFVPTPQEVVDEMLRMANVTKNDFIIDLGSGDGRIVVTAAQKYGAHGIGIDINPERIAEARANAKQAGVTDLVEFRQGDLFKADLSKATVVTMYLLSSVNLKLRPKLLRELKPGTKLVSHAFDMGEWKPERTADVDGRRVMLWTIPAKAPQFSDDVKQ
jgi:SAM-dependent methyltransferase